VHRALVVAAVHLDVPVLAPAAQTEVAVATELGDELVAAVENLDRMVAWEIGRAHV